ncbi:MAG: glycoside hydrolase family 5 protein [Polyangiaceae bacterium]|jgi:endoglucanase
MTTQKVLRTVAIALATSSAACSPTAAPAHSAATIRPAAVREAPHLMRGLNLGDALEAPTEGAWGVVLSAADFVAVAHAGFDHVRLPVRFNGHAAPTPPYPIDPLFLQRVDWAIDQALANGLAIVVDFHGYEELMGDPEAHRARFLAIWRQIAERCRSRPAGLAFELLNEPNGALTADTWNGILSDALRIVRATNPSRTVVIEGVFWASAKNLRDTLVVPDDDPNIVGSFHMYQPILFTHQGAEWMGREYQTHGVVFPGPPTTPIVPVESAIAVDWVRHWFARYNEEPAGRNPSGPQAITEQLDMARIWADRHHLPVYMGEFGADDIGDPRSRAVWTKTTRVEAERRGFGWAYWDDGGRFQALDRKTHEWVAYLKAALLD